MTAYPSQTLTQTTLGLLCTALWDSQSQLVVIQPGIEPGFAEMPLALRCSALDRCTTQEPDMVITMSVSWGPIRAVDLKSRFILGKVMAFLGATDLGDNVKPMSKAHQPMVRNLHGANIFARFGPTSRQCGHVCWAMLDFSGKFQISVTHTVGASVGLQQVRQHAFLHSGIPTQVFPIQDQEEALQLLQELIQH